MIFIRIFFIFLSTVSVMQASAQDTAVTFTEIVQVESATKDELYQRGRLWFASTFGDSKAVFEIQDKETGELVGKGIVKGKSAYRALGKDWITTYCYSFMLRIVVKDGRYKYDVTHIKIDGVENDMGLCIEHPYNGAITSRIEGRFKIKMVSQKKTDSDYANVRAVGLEEVQRLMTDLKLAMARKSGNDDF